jgi:hypothetical protein
MMSDDDVLVATIDELLTVFRSALLSLLPCADQAKLAWTDDSASPAWEKLTSATFDAFVRSPIQSDRLRDHDAAPLARYDLDLHGYAETSWIGVGQTDCVGVALIRLLSVSEPFDHVQVADIDLETGAAIGRRLIPWADATFFLVRRSSGGGLSVTTSIEADE